MIRASEAAFSGDRFDSRQDGISGDRAAFGSAVARMNRIIDSQASERIAANGPANRESSADARKSTIPTMAAGTIPRASPSATAPISRLAKVGSAMRGSRPNRFSKMRRTAQPTRIAMARKPRLRRMTLGRCFLSGSFCYHATGVPKIPVRTWPASGSATEKVSGDNGEG